MSPEPSAAEPLAESAAEAAAIAAPPREKRLVPAAPKPRPAPVRLVRVRAEDLPVGKPTRVSTVENKVAALRDADEMLNVVRTEAALRRAQRLSGAGDAQRQTIRLLSVFMLFALVVAAVGAMWWLQTSLQGSRRSAHRPVPAAAPAAPAR